MDRWDKVEAAGLCLWYPLLAFEMYRSLCDYTFHMILVHRKPPNVIHTLLYCREVVIAFLRQMDSDIRYKDELDKLIVVD